MRSRMYKSCSAGMLGYSLNDGITGDIIFRKEENTSLLYSELITDVGGELKLWRI